MGDEIDRRPTTVYLPSFPFFSSSEEQDFATLSHQGLVVTIKTDT